MSVFASFNLNGLPEIEKFCAACPNAELHIVALKNAATNAFPHHVSPTLEIRKRPDNPNAMALLMDITIEDPTDDDFDAIAILDRDPAVRAASEVHILLNPIFL
jgi:hypothetical protein